MAKGKTISMKDYLKPTKFIDSDAEIIQQFAKEVTKGATSDKEKAIRLYYAVRDKIRYDPYKFFLTEENYTASKTLEDGASFCIPKAVLLAATARAIGIPARLGFADIKNHLSTKKLLNLMGTDLFVWHSYTEFFLDDKWVKATPAFNIEMCERFGVKPLEFDGVNDSFMHEFNNNNEKHMEYLNDHGSFDDLPFERIINAFKENYPAFCATLGQEKNDKYDFAHEKITG